MLILRFVSANLGSGSVYFHLNHSLRPKKKLESKRNHRHEDGKKLCLIWLEFFARTQRRSCCGCCFHRCRFFFLLRNRFSWLLSQAALHDFAHPIEYWFDCWQFKKKSIQFHHFCGFLVCTVHSSLFVFTTGLPVYRFAVFRFRMHAIDVIIHSFVMGKQLKRTTSKQSVHYCNSTLRFYDVKSSSSNCFPIHTRSILLFVSNSLSFLRIFCSILLACLWLVV